MVTEIDPICALQAAMEGYEVVTMEDAATRGDIFVTATGNIDVITLDHMRAMKHTRDRLQHRPLRYRDPDRGAQQLKWDEVKPQVDEVEFPDGKQIIVLAKGRLVNLGCATGHPSFVMSTSFTNQVLAQIELWTNGASTRRTSTCCPSTSTRRSPRLHLDKLGVQADQAQRPPGATISACRPTGPTSRIITATEPLPSAAASTALLRRGRGR